MGGCVKGILVKTKRKYFDLFVEECEYWIKFYGLKEWDVNYSLAELDEGDSANTYVDLASMSATIVLAEEYPLEFVCKEHLKKDIRETAHHEVVELLISKLHIYAMSPCGCNQYLEEGARHEIIMKLNNAIFKRKGKKI